MRFQKNNKKVITAWTIYDWANSVYPLVVTTSIFPIFYESITSPQVTFLGLEFANTEIYSYVVSLSYVIVSFLSPLLSGVADYSGNKKSYMRFFCYLGAFSCMSLFFFDAGHLELSMLSVLLAGIGGLGVINGLFGIREAILMLMVFFAIGFLLLLTIPKQTDLKTRRENH